MTPDEHDRHLFYEIGKDNRLAFNTLFVKYFEPLCRFAIRYVHTSEDAEEIVSDVFLTIWKNARRTDITSSLKSYLYACVRHGAMAFINKKGLGTFMITPGFDVEDRIEEDDNQQLIELQSAIEELPPRCREVLHLCRYAGLKQREAAQVLGLSEKTIEHHLARAMELLRHHLLRGQQKITVTDT